MKKIIIIIFALICFSSCTMSPVLTENCTIKAIHAACVYKLNGYEVKIQRGPTSNIRIDHCQAQVLFPNGWYYVGFVQGYFKQVKQHSIYIPTTVATIEEAVKWL